MLRLCRRWWLGWLLLSVSISASPCRAESAPASALNAEAIRAHAEFLGSDLLEGRATGSRGYELAAAYVAAQFRQAGLATLLEQGSYLQPAALIEASVVLPGSTLSIKRDTGVLNFEFGKDYLPMAHFFNSNLTLTAPMAFVGYGIDAPEYQYNDFSGVDLQGRIAVLLEGAPERFSEAARNYYAWRDTKYAQLVKLGAVGVLEIVSTQKTTDGAPSHWEQAVATSWHTEMRAVTAAEQPAELFPELKLRFRINADAAAQLFNVPGRSYEQVQQSIASSTAQGFALPGTLTMTATTGLRRMDSSNVLGVVRGSDAKLRNEYVLVVAHLDGLGRGPAVNGDSIYNGMQRNAVGVAMMLEMARALASAPVKPKRSIVFAAVAAGDKQGQGLQYLLQSSVLNARRIAAALVLDTPLPMTRTSDVEAAGAADSSLGVLLTQVTQQLKLSVSSTRIESLLRDASVPLVRAKVPVICLSGGAQGRAGRSAIRALKRQWWHEWADQPSDDEQHLPMDAQAASELAALNAALAQRIADAESRPHWYRSSVLMRR